MGYTARFNDDACLDPDLAGGKGVNLGRLTAAGFPVPPGFVVTTGAYRDFLRADGLDDRIAEAVRGLDFTDVDAVDRTAATIRGWITAAELPGPLTEEIRRGYGALGDSAFVAVRSSGTAEDLAGASFAGLHDTYLDVRGPDAVLTATRDCWASLWTARALAYRHDKGFDHTAESLAVVVQVMVESQASGVLFTANPVNGLNSEFVVNAGWGLGEGIVSGIVSPDEVVLRAGDLSVKRRTAGEKAVKVVRAAAGTGTETVDVAPADRSRFCLDDARLAELGALGRRIMAYYDGIPQDVEWALHDGDLWILQARDVTGVDFTWDEDCDAWQTVPDDESTIWSRGYADQYLTGAITPLFYSVRVREFTRIHQRFQKLLGFTDLAQMRPFRYYRAEAYYNSRIDATYYTYVLPQSMRPGAFAMSPQSMIDKALTEPFSLGRYLKAQLRVSLLEPDQRVYRWFSVIRDYLDNRGAEADGLSDDELARLDDRELMRYADSKVDLADRFIGDEWIAFFLYAPTALFTLGKMLEKWYDGDNPTVFGDLLSGLPEQSTTVQENNLIWELAAEIRRTPALLAAFERTEGSAFFTAAESIPEAATFRERYQELVDQHGHRGHADRDFFYPRRAEDPGLDHRAFAAFISAGDATPPTDREEQLRAQRETVTADVVERIRRTPFGSVKAEAFKLVLDYCHKFLVLRDDQRHYIDRVTFTKKRAFAEMGRRLVVSGMLDADDDFYFLAKEELYEALAGTANKRLLRAKIAGRRRVHARFDAKEELPPPYLVNDVAADLDGTEGGSDDSGGVLAGLATSRGRYTGTARVITELSSIGQIRKGDILITNSTDPGWTPVFMVIGALVLETGGMLSHGACLSREYGFPSITVPNAAKRIPDGATITVDGNTGQVVVESEMDATAEAGTAVHA